MSDITVTLGGADRSHIMEGLSSRAARSQAAAWRLVVPWVVLRQGGLAAKMPPAMPMNRSVSRRYRDADGTWVTVTERSGTRRRFTRTATYLFGPASYKNTTTTRRYANGMTVTERNEHHPWWTALSILILIWLLVEGFGSKKWYWVLASAIVTGLIVLGVIGALSERIGKARNPARRRTKDVDHELKDALNRLSVRVVTLSGLINERMAQGIRDHPEDVELAQKLQDASQRLKHLDSQVNSKGNALERAAQRLEAETLSLDIEGLIRRAERWPGAERWPPPTNTR